MTVSWRWARSWLVQGRDIHQQWLDYLRSDPVGRGELAQEAAREVGGIEWHARRIAEYDQVIALIDHLLEGEAASTPGG